VICIAVFEKLIIFAHENNFQINNKLGILTTEKRTIMGIGFQEILVIALIILLLFGGKKIPELMKGLGKGVKSFKDGMREIDEPDNAKGDVSAGKSEEK